jgi:hypothetical protein
MKFQFRENAPLRERLLQLEKFYENECETPFPYTDIGKLLQDRNGGFEGLIPDIAMYFADLVGYCSWGNKMMKWSAKKIDEATVALQKPFFERFPQYKVLLPAITKKAVPDLYSDLENHEAVRKALLNVFSELPASKP